MSAGETSRSASVKCNTVHAPMTIPQRVGRKLVEAPDGATAWAQQRTRIDSILIKALARAQRWKRMHDEGR